MTAQQKLNGVGKAHDAQGTAGQDGEQVENAALKVAKQVGDGADDLVVNTHGEGHGPPGYAGDDVGNSDEHSLDDVQYQCHVQVPRFLRL